MFEPDGHYGCIYTPFARGRFDAYSVGFVCKRIACRFAQRFKHRRQFSLAHTTAYRDRQRNVVLVRGFAFFAGRISRADGFAEASESAEIAQPLQLRAGTKMDGAVSRTCPESKSRLSQRINIAALSLRQSLVRKPAASFLRGDALAVDRIYILARQRASDFILFRQLRRDCISVIECRVADFAGSFARCTYGLIFADSMR